MKYLFDAAVLYNHKSNLKIVKNIKIPKIKKSQILIKIKYSGICGSQIHEINGGRDNKKYLPHMLGHEGTGVVVNKAYNVKNFKINDKVFVSWIKNKKIDSDFPSYYFKNKKINAGLVTTFNTYAIVSANRVFKLPKSISYKKGVLLSCSLPTGSAQLLKEKKLKDKKILIIGLGGVGMSSFITLKYLNVKNISILEKNSNKIKLAKNIFKKNKKISFYKNIKFIKDKKFDLVLESSGQVDLINKSIDLIYNHGKIIISSHPDYKKKISFYPHELIKGKLLIGNWGGGINYTKDLPYLEKILKQKINYGKIFFKRIYNLKNINLAIRDFKNGKVLKPIIKL